MKFKSRKDLLFSVIILGFSGYLISLLYSSLTSKPLETIVYVTMIVMLGVLALLLWSYFGTYYTLSKDNGLTYRSGLFSGTIKIERITEIIKGKTMWVGLKPATSRNGLIIKYDKYNEIYISPNTNESFVKKILELKSDIKITE